MRLFLDYQLLLYQHEHLSLRCALIKVLRCALIDLPFNFSHFQVLLLFL